MSTHIGTQKTGETESATGDINNNSDVGNNNVVIYETISDPLTSLRPLVEIWDCEYVKRFTAGNKNTKRWQWCWWPKSGNESSDFSSHNATKLLCHVCKISGYDVFPCNGWIVPKWLRWYKDIHKRKMESKQSNRGEVILMIFCFQLLYYLNCDNLLSEPV